LWFVFWGGFEEAFGVCSRSGEEEYGFCYPFEAAALSPNF